MTTRFNLDPDAPDVPAGLQPRDGVEFGCGDPKCIACYEPILNVHDDTESEDDE